MSNVIDLDILRPEPKTVKLNGKVFDVSFIPTAITFDVDEIVRELSNIDIKDIDNKVPEVIKKSFDLSIKLCVAFVKYQFPEMDEDWFRKNTSAGQIESFSNAIQEALIESYKGVEEYGKN